MFDIDHQPQPTPHTCAQACLAMVTGHSVKEVIGILGDKELSYRDEIKFLVDHKIFPTPINSVDHKMVIPYHGFYLGTCPSLNTPGKLHRVIVENLVENLDEIVVRDPCFDPELKTQERKFYQWNAVYNNEIFFFELTYLDLEILK